ncbi:MAG: ThiF family adenylyltransferase, partial [Myxococcales bacterium]|nr:ThiF family adenylyltransferase [Myxococcales bacterium]
MSTLAALEQMLDTGERELLVFTLGPGERPRLASLAWTDGLDVVDSIDQQLEEWVRTALPGEPRGGTAHQEAIAREKGADPDTYGAWVYFPWRGLITRLLPRERFREVRTNRNRTKITDAQQRMLLERRIGVVGLSVGHASALVLAQEGLCAELRIADFDVIELSNLNRLRTSLAHLGCSKLEVTRREVAEIDPWIKVV